MSEPVIIFKDLPATFPEKDRYKKPSVVGSIVFHVALLTVLVLIPLLMPQHIEQWKLVTFLVSPIGPPPPPPPPPPVEVAAVAQPARPAIAKILKPSPDAVIMPTAIPKEIARIVDEPIAPPSGGVIGGVPGGVPGGVVGGVLGSILSRNIRPLDVAPVPPPPPPPTPPPPPPSAPAPSEPVRVGGNIREPRVIALVPPVYPPLASKARVSGTVVLEATLTAEGTVDEIRVISGHPLLIEAAIEAVKQWRYEPTYLNGIPVPVILTAKVNFYRGPIS